MFDTEKSKNKILLRTITKPQYHQYIFYKVCKENCLIPIFLLDF